MPLDPNRFRQERRSSTETLRLAVEWSAIIFVGMLAILFLLVNHFANALSSERPPRRSGEACGRSVTAKLVDRLVGVIAAMQKRRFWQILLQKSLTRRLPGFEARLLFHCLTSGGARKAHQLVAGRARHAPLAGGGRAISFTSLRRFCAIAASMNSN